MQNMLCTWYFIQCIFYFTWICVVCSILVVFQFSILNVLVSYFFKSTKISTCLTLLLDVLSMQGLALWPTPVTSPLILHPLKGPVGAGSLLLGLSLDPHEKKLGISSGTSIRRPLTIAWYAICIRYNWYGSNQFVKR